MDSKVEAVERANKCRFFFITNAILEFFYV